MRNHTTKRTKPFFLVFVIFVVISVAGCDPNWPPTPGVTPAPTPSAPAIGTLVRGGVTSWRGTFADDLQGTGASGPCTVQLHIRLEGAITCSGFEPDLACTATGSALYTSEERQDDGDYHYHHTEQGTFTGRFAASLDLEPEGGQTHYTLNVVSIVPINAVTDDPHATPAHQEAQHPFTLTTTPDGLTDLATGVIRYDHTETLDKAEAACDELTTGTHTTTLTLTRDR
jgi:hypothetical protein